MNESKKLPSKIANLYWLKNEGFIVPNFFVLSRETVENIDAEIEKIHFFFSEKSIKNIIIRSASSSEDQKNKSLAGFFESSDSIKAKDLKIEDIQRIWFLNCERLEKTENKKPLYLFIQEFLEFDYSGVLFTQNIYDAQKAVLNLAQEKFGITSGKSAQKSIIYKKEDKRWLGADRVISKKNQKGIGKIN